MRADAWTPAYAGATKVGIQFPPGQQWVYAGVQEYVRMAHRISAGIPAFAGPFAGIRQRLRLL